MNFNFDRMAMLAGIESTETKVLNENASVYDRAPDEQRIRDIIREELESALDDILAKRDQKAFQNARDTKSLVQASHFVNSTKYGKIQPAPAPGASSARPQGSLGFVGGLGFH